MAVLNEKQGNILLKKARMTIDAKLAGKSIEMAISDAALQKDGATFVTLKKKGKLRGCIGSLEPNGSLFENVARNALNAAFHDYRFSRLTQDEWPDITIDISVLSSPQPLQYTDGNDLCKKLRPQVDGVILRDGARSATFLPQVWEQLPTPELFLGHLCQKAGLPQDIWREKKLEIQLYQVQHFEEDIR